MKLLYMLFIVISIQLMADDFDTLLNDYKQASDLSQKTKDESAGNIIVYTRDDLERMQVESLKDILKSLRFFAYYENRMGQTDIFNADPLSYYSQTVRVYLNNTELLTSLTGSGLILFGDMEMDFIDHVEIYEGFPSFDFGIEPATVVIRLYSKSAAHDEGGRVKVQVGSYGTNKQNVYYSAQEEEYEYFFYANRNDMKKDEYEHDGEILKHDRRVERFYGSVNNNQHKLEIHVQKISSDALLGSLIGEVPSSTKIDSQFINISTESKFINDSLVINFSYIDEDEDLAYKYNRALDLQISPTIILPVKSFDQNIYQEAFTANIKKYWDINGHDISIGLQYRYKHFDINDYSFTYQVPILIPILPIQKTYDTQNIYSFFIQDEISLDDNNILSFSFMHQYYDRNKDAKDIQTSQFRLGYTYSKDRWVSKTFISSQEFAPEPYMAISPAYGNIDLEADKYTSLYQEISYNLENTMYRVLLGGGYNEKLPILNNAGKVVNNTSNTDGYFASFEFVYKFRDKDKLELGANLLYVENPYKSHEFYRHYNYLIRLLNTIDKFDIFNELIINSGYSNQSVAYDYSMGVKYEVTKDLHMSFKGENLFNDSLDESYLNKIIPTIDTVTIPTIERRVLFSMEYLF